MDQKTLSYHMADSKVKIDSKLVFETKEEALIHHYRQYKKAYSKKRSNLLAKIALIDKEYEEMKKEVEIDKLKKTNPEDMLI